MSTFDEDTLSEDPQERTRQLRAYAKPAPPVEEVQPARTVQGPPRRATPVTVPETPVSTVAPAQRSGAPTSAATAPVREPVREAVRESETPSEVDESPGTVFARSSGVDLDEVRAPEARVGRFGGRPTHETTFGRKVGNQRQIGLYLPRNVREALKARYSASRETRGAILIEAFRTGYRTLLAEYGQVVDEDPMFGAPVRSARQVDDGATVVFYVSAAQTQSIVDIAEQLGVSVSEAGTMALSLYLLGPESLTS